MPEYISGRERKLNVGIVSYSEEKAALSVVGNSNFTGVITATSFSKSGGTSSQFLKADGSVDSSTYLTSFTETDTLDSVTGRGNSTSNGISVTGVVTATTFKGSLATTNLEGTITNSQLAGSIANGKLVNSSVNFGGVTVSLGATDATPAFDLSDATSYPYTSLTGVTTEVSADTTPQLGGNLDLNSKDITGTGNIDITGNLNVSGVSTFQDKAHFLDNDRLHFGGAVGDSGDLQIYHDGSDSYVRDLGTGRLVLQSDQIDFISSHQFGGTLASFHHFGASELYHDNTKRLHTYSSGVIITGILSATGSVKLNNNKKALFGTFGGLEIYNDGSDSYIFNNRSTQNLKIKNKFDGTGEIQILNNTTTSIANTSLSSYSAKFISGEAVELYYDNSKKFETTNHGIVITGIATATSFVGDITGDVTGNSDTATTATNAQGLTGSPDITITNVTGVAATFSGNVTIGGTLSYQDVENIDSIGIITAQQGIQVLANGLDITGFSTFKTGVSVTGVVTATTFKGSLSTNNLEGTITNSQLAGSIANGKLANSSIAIGGITFNLGDTDATPAFDLSDATSYPYTSLTGVTTEVSADTTPQLGGNLDLNSKDITGTGNVNVTGIITATALAGFDYLQAPHGSTVNYSVTVASKTSAHRYNGTGSGNGYVINGVESPFLTLTPGRTYRFTLSSSDMSSHPFRFYLEADKTTAYTTNVTSTATYTEIVVTDETPIVLHYQCSAHGYMGNAVQVNSNKVDTPYQIDGLKGANITGVVTATSFVGDVTGNVTGNADTSTTATNVTVSANNSTDETVYPIFVDGATGTQGAESDTGLTYNPNSGTLTATTFSGSGSSLTGLTGASAATYGNTAATPVIVVDSNGRITGISTAAISGNEVVDDTTPQLGGDLDLNSKFITGSGGISISGVVTSTSFVGDITGDVTGNADTATTSTNFTVSANNSTDETVYPVFVDGATGTQGAETDTGLSYNPNSGTLTATTFSGSGSSLTGLTGASADTYGDSGATPVIVVDSNGRITGISTAAISGGGGGGGGASEAFKTIAVSGQSNVVADNASDTLTFVAGNGITITTDATADSVSIASSTITRTVTRVVATDAQTAFTVAAYDSSFIDVYLNGVKLDSTEYATTNSTTITLTTGASTGDIFESVSYSNFTGVDANATSLQDSGGNIKAQANPGGVVITGVATATSFVGDITGDVTGNADTATTATNVTVSANNSTDETVYPIFVDGATGTQGAETDTGLNYNPSTGNLTSTLFTGNVTGNVTGNADTATTSTNFTVTANNSTDETVYPVFVDGATGTQGAETDTGLSYNPNSGTLTATTFSGSGSNLTGLTGASAATYGNTAATPVIVVDSNGRITGISTAAISGGGGGISNVVEDTTPQLGGNLDLNSKFITGSGGVSVSGVVTSTSFVGDITGDVTGNADTSTTATNVTVSANNSTDETVYPIFVDGATGAQGAESDTGLTYNPSSGTLTATTFSGSGSSLTGLTGASAATYGDASNVAAITVDANGRITGISEVTISGGGGGGGGADINEVMLFG